MTTRHPHDDLRTLHALRLHYDAQAAGYDDAYSDPLSQWENARVKAMLRPLVGASVLDLGCGTGLFLDLGFDPACYLGIDLSPRMVEEARRKHPRRCFRPCGMGAPTLPGHWETVIALFGSASYLLDGDLSPVWNRLALGGKFLVMLFSGQASDGVFLRTDRGCPDLPAVPARYWTRAGALAAARSAGMVRVRAVGFNAGVPLGAAPSLRTRFWNGIAERQRPDTCVYIVLTGEKPGA